MNIAAIDIGGTQLRLGVFDDQMNLVKVFKTDNDRTLGGKKNIDRLLEKLDVKCDAIGIASPGPLNVKKGLILNPPNLYGWNHFFIVDYIKEKTGVTAVINNDGNLAGYAEALIGAGRGYESVVFIGMSTGMGGSFVYKGELINGAHFNTAEFYNVIVSDDSDRHGSANPGSLNEIAGGAAMERIASRVFNREVDAKELFHEYDLGNETAKEILDKTSDALAKGIANIFYTIDPDIYVIGGSIGVNNPWYVDLVIRKARQYLVDQNIKVAYAQLGDDAGLYGAALLAKKAIEK